MDVKGVLKFLKLEGVAGHLSGYAEDRIELLKLELKEGVASIGAKVLPLVAVLIFGLCCLLFVSIATAVMLNNILKHNFAGYFITAGIYFIFTVVAFILKDNVRIKSTLANVIDKAFDKEK